MNALHFELRIFVLFFLSCLALTSCSSTAVNNSNNTNSNVSNTRNDYPQESVDAFLKSCEGAGSKHEFCSCILDKIQRKYTFEEFSVIETKMRAGRTPDEFLEFSGKARAECMK